MSPSTRIFFSCALAAWSLSLEPAAALVTESSDPQHVQEAGLQRTVGSVMRPAPRFPFWLNMGMLNQSTGVYLGNGYVLTAAHVGPGLFYLQDGSCYHPVPGSETSFPKGKSKPLADLCLFRVSYRRSDLMARLPAIPLRRSCPSRGCSVLLLGAGSGNASDDPARVGFDFRWNDHTRMRWGLNRVEYQYDDPIETYAFRTSGFSTQFSAEQLECQATPGDSGGAAFSYNPVFKRWELCGIILAVDGTEGQAAYGNQTYIGDLSAIPAQNFATPAVLASY